MNLTQVSIKRPSVIIVIFSLLALFGLLCFHYLGYELIPSMASPVITVATVYPGAAPSEVENQITKKIEDGLATLNNIDFISSQSIENVSIVAVYFKNGTDVDFMLQEAQRKIDKVRKDLPDDAKNPTLAKISPNDSPILTLVVNSNLPNTELYQKVKDRYLPIIQQVKGVAEVTMLGGEEREIRVNVNKDKLKYYNLSILQITKAINYANLEFPTGKIKNADEQLTVKLAGKFASLDDIKNLVVYKSPAGNPIRVSDVAEVKDGLKETESIARFNGENGIAISIKKTSDGNNVEISKNVHDKLKILETENKSTNLKFTDVSDDSVITKQSVNSVLKDLILAIVLVGIIMYLFLHNFRNSMIVIISIPISLISSFIMIQLSGFTLNLMTLLGMTLVIGILVDDSIVVLENIQRHLEMGKDKVTATYDGIKEITFAAISITAVIVIVFIPLTFIRTMVSDILRQFAFTVAFTTMVSLFSSLTLSVWLSSRFAKLDELNPKKPVQKFLVKFESLLNKLTDYYGKILDWCLSHKTIVIGIIVILFVFTGLIMKMGILGSELVAMGDQGKFRMSFEFSKSTALSQNNLIMQDVEHYIMNKPEVEYVFANVGGPKTGIGGTGFGVENESELTIQLKDENQREKISTEKYMLNLRKELEKKYQGIKYTSSVVGITDIAIAPVEIVLLGDNYDILFKEAKHIAGIVENIPGAIDTKVSIEEKGNPELRIDMNNEKMADFGLSTAIVGGTLQNALSGNNDSKYRENGTDYDIRVKMDAFDRRNPDDIKEIGFINNMGQQIQLSQFANVQRSAGPNMLERRDRRSSIRITASNLGRSNGSIVNDINDALKKDPVDPSISIQWGLLNKAQDESFGALGMAIVISIMMIYFILVILFDNFLYPVVILFSIPVALIGAFLALNLSISNISIFSILGVLMLLGLVSKNAILIVDFANKLKADGVYYRDALIEAGKLRLRPILMTTVAMVVGMIPVAIAKGADAEWKNGLALVLIGGLLSSMVITVFLIPVLYFIIDRFKEKYGRKTAANAGKVQIEKI
ncbi:MAG: efflux RND transporter permease subunit [Ignavibacteria bacterium]|nr:efflux RND transporter permease subunit [Ignavibacteria bacterium]